MDAHEKRQLMERYIDAYNRRDVDAMLAVLTPDILFENVSAGVTDASASGIDEFREMAWQAAAIFPDRRQTVLTLNISPSSAVAAIGYRGVLAVDMPDGPKAGDVIELSGESEFEFAEGRISHLVDRSRVPKSAGPQ